MTPYPLPLLPQHESNGLTTEVSGINESQQPITLRIIGEAAWTIYLNAHEIVTVMTIGDYPDLLATGYLLNQNLIESLDSVTAVDIDLELQVVVVRTNDATCPNLSRQIRTSGCAEGTMFAHVLENLPQKNWYQKASLTKEVMIQMLKQINTTPSLYLEAGAIHGCCLCQQDQLIAYLEDVGRHNAVDKIAGLMHRNQISGDDCWFYTTGRLTTEMVLKTAQMGIPILISRSGFTAAGVALAQKCGLTLIGRARGKRFVLLSHPERIVFS